MDYKKHLIKSNSTIREALEKLNVLASDAILFVVDEKEHLIGSLTDGDVRRGLLKGFDINNLVEQIIQNNPKFIRKGERDINKIIEYRENNFKILPVLEKESNQIVNIINFRLLKSYLPIDAIVMAGGKGVRLMPLTATTPKPLLKVGDKPILEHNIDRLIHFGIDDFWISINYLGEQIKHYFNNGKEKNVTINYIEETIPLGTVGAIAQATNLKHDTVLITNSDLLTNVDYEKFYLDFINTGADMSVISIPYKVVVPYAIFENDNRDVTAFKEKPTYTYYANGGIYLVKKEILELIPKNTFYNATDLMDQLIALKKNIITFPHNGYWLDIGKMDDFEKAQKDIVTLQF